MFKRIRNKIRQLRMPPSASVRHIFSETPGRAVDLLDRGAGPAGNDWDQLVHNIADEVARNPGGFLREPTISRTVHPAQYTLAQEYFKELCSDEFFRSRIFSQLHEHPMGDPFLCPFFPYASTMTMQHAYYLNMIYHKFGIYLPENPVRQVVEIGAGYGNMFRLLSGMGYTACYTVIDLPAMQALQRHYLEHIFPRATCERIDFYTSENVDGTHIDSESLIFGTFSLSEMPLATRVRLEPLYARARYLFFAFNKAFDGVDNEVYFSDLREKLSSLFDIDIIKDSHRRAWFFLGTRKKDV